MVSPAQQKMVEHLLLLFSLRNCQSGEIYSSNIYSNYYSNKRKLTLIITLVFMRVTFFLSFPSLSHFLFPPTFTFYIPLIYSNNNQSHSKFSKLNKYLPGQLYWEIYAFLQKKKLYWEIDLYHFNFMAILIYSLIFKGKKTGCKS